MLSWRKKLLKAFSEESPISVATPNCQDTGNSVKCPIKQRARLGSNEQSRLIRSFGKKGSRPEQFNTPVGITVTRKGELSIICHMKCSPGARVSFGLWILKAKGLT